MNPAMTNCSHWLDLEVLNKGAAQTNTAIYGKAQPVLTTGGKAVAKEFGFVLRPKPRYVICVICG